MFEHYVAPSTSIIISIITKELLNYFTGIFMKSISREVTLITLYVFDFLCFTLKMFTMKFIRFLDKYILIHYPIIFKDYLR